MYIFGSATWQSVLIVDPRADCAGPSEEGGCKTLAPDRDDINTFGLNSILPNLHVEDRSLYSPSDT